MVGNKNEVVKAIYDQDQCPICMDPFTDKSKARHLKGCNHVMHEKCLTEYVKNK